MIIDNYGINSCYSDHNFSILRDHFAYWASYWAHLNRQDLVEQEVREDRNYRFYDC